MELTTGVVAVVDDEGVVILLPLPPPPPLEDPYEPDDGLKLVLGIAGLFAGFITIDDDDDDDEDDAEEDDELEFVEFVPELLLNELLQLDAADEGALVVGAEPRFGAGIFCPSHGTAAKNTQRNQ